jgi:PAS domain S-box-containing protein
MTARSVEHEAADALLGDQQQGLERIGGASLAHRAVESRGSDEALRKSEDVLRMVIDTIPAMAWSVLPDGTVDFLNQRWMDYAGLSLQEYVKDPMQVIHPEDIPRVMEKWLIDMPAGLPYEDEMRLRRADGEYRWFLIRTVPLRDRKKNIVKWYGTSTDIEDRKRAEDALRESEDRLRLVVDTIPALVWSALPDGSVDFVNDRWLQHTGLSREALLGWGWTAAIHPDDVARTISSWREALLSGEPAESEERLRRSDGGFRWFLCRYIPVCDDSGKIVKWYGTRTDIEDRKQAEDTLRRNQAFFAAEAKRIGRLLETASPDHRSEPADAEHATAARSHEARKSVPGDRAAPENRRFIAERQAIESLTVNERLIIRLVSEGKSNAEVAEHLHFSPRTVETYRARLMQKLQLEDLVALVKFAIRNGMSSVD